MPPRRRRYREENLSYSAVMRCRWDIERDIVSFAVVLVAEIDGAWRSIALFDCSHGGRNDRHRYDRNGRKGVAEQFHDGTPGEAYRAAIDLVHTEYERMIEQWRQ